MYFVFVSVTASHPFPVPPSLPHCPLACPHSHPSSAGTLRSPTPSSCCSRGRGLAVQPPVVWLGCWWARWTLCLIPSLHLTASCTAHPHQSYTTVGQDASMCTLYLFFFIIIIFIYLFIYLFYFILFLFYFFFYIHIHLEAPPC